MHELPQTTDPSLSRELRVHNISYQWSERIQLGARRRQRRFRVRIKEGRGVGKKMRDELPHVLSVARP